MIPTTLDLQSLQEVARRLQRLEESQTARNVNMQGRRIINAGDSVSPFDYVTRRELDEKTDGVAKTAETQLVGMLNAATTVRRGVYANRGAAVAHANEIFIASDRSNIAFFSTGAVWIYASGVHYDAIANRPTPTSDETNYRFYATDTFRLYYWTGSAWVEDILSTLEVFGGLTSSFPALKRSSAILQARLADDSAYTDLEVLDEAYDATNWNAVVEVPTKNGVRDKFEQLAPGLTDALVNDTAYDATSWNGDTSHAPSRNAVRDKIETVTGGETAALVSDTAYASGWNGVTTIAPSKNAVYDKIESLLLDSGTYSPTLTNVANLDGSTTQTCQYSRVGNRVTVSGYVLADTTTAGVLTQLRMSVPINSNFSAPEQAAGVGACAQISDLTAAIQADTANNVLMQWTTAADTSNRAIFFVFFYQVI